MTAKTVSILTNPHPKSHIVYPYGDDFHIAEAVSIFTAAGLNQDEAVILIMTDEKRRKSRPCARASVWPWILSWSDCAPTRFE